MVRELVLPKTFGPAQAPAWFESWSAVAREPELRLHLPSGAFVRPTGIALLAAGIAERKLAGLKTSLTAEPGAEEAVARPRRTRSAASRAVATARASRSAGSGREAVTRRSSP